MPSQQRRAHGSAASWSACRRQGNGGGQSDYFRQEIEKGIVGWKHDARTQNHGAGKRLLYKQISTASGGSIRMTHRYANGSAFPSETLYDVAAQEARSPKKQSPIFILP